MRHLPSLLLLAALLALAVGDKHPRLMSIVF
jgi:hypothetical protein